MRLSFLRIKNFCSCRDISIQIGGMHALVGANNSGKSSVLRAIDFLFNPSSKSINEETFWNKDTKLQIWVEAIFTDLTATESETLKSYLKDDNSFHMARSARFGGGEEDTKSIGTVEEEKVIIEQHYLKPIPELEWLQESAINTKSITEWWKTKEKLVINDLNFLDLLGKDKKPGVDDWKEKAREFINKNSGNISMKEAWIDNPKGYANVLKGTLPFFILVPAVRDVIEESKANKSNPFGKLLYAIIGSVEADKKDRIGKILDEISKQMNRHGGTERVSLIAETEKGLNSLLGDFFKGCDLEIEFQTPTLEILLSSPKLYVDDGFRNAVENKGHGLQRAVIFSILKRYAEHMTQSTSGTKKRNIIIAIEEPELYMHPQAQRTIRRALTKISSGGDQVIYSTHSSLLVDVACFDEIIRMESTCEQIDEKKIPVCHARQLPMATLIKDIERRHTHLKDKVSPESMRDRYSHAYNPRRNEGFFAAKIILVEGATEEYSLPIYADAIEGKAFDPIGISVVECGGKGTMDRLYRIFNELHIPCYILFDYDRDSKDKNVISKSKEIINLVGESFENPSSFYASDKIACFPNKWEKDVNSEISNIAELTAEARKELGINDDDCGKPLVARYIARKLVKQMPPFVPECIKKVIENTINVKWEKSCLFT
jgi:putative ATP-dependent endonuclease of the OLD family